MSDDKDKTDDGKPQAPTGTPSQTGPRAPLSLRPRQQGAVAAGTVRQSFSHGRSKTVVVETKRRVGGPSPVQRQLGFDVARPRPHRLARPQRRLRAMAACRRASRRPVAAPSRRPAPSV